MINLINDNDSWGYQNEKITNEGIKELAINISKLKNLTELNLYLRRLFLL